MTTRSHDPYPFIRAYGRMVGSFATYIDRQIDLATADNAPANAVYRNHDGGWTTTDDIVSVDTRRALGLQPLPPIRVTVGAIVDDIAGKLHSSSWLRDRHGLVDVHTDNATLTLTFTTGHAGVIRVEVSEPATN